MNRRGFLSSIVAAVAARFAPRRLDGMSQAEYRFLRSFGAPSRVVPNPAALRNTVLTPSAISREALMLLENSLTFTRAQNTLNYQASAIAETIAARPKIGETLNLRTPPRFETRWPSLLVNGQKVNIPASGELTLSVKDFSERVLAPQIRELEDRAEVRADRLRHQTPNLF